MGNGGAGVDTRDASARSATSPPGRARAEGRVDGDALIVSVGGTWSIEQPQVRATELVGTATGAAARGRPAVRTMRFDCSQLDSWDSSLLVLLGGCQQWAQEHDVAVDPSGLPPEVVRLLQLAHAVPERLQESEHTEPPPFLARVGLAGQRAWEELRAAVAFAGEVVIALGNVAVRRVRLPWRDFWMVVQASSSGALPIVTLIALLVGIIIAFLGVVVLERFGAGYYVSYLVGFGMLREMGALMTGIIIAGRTGAAFAAELGSMKITEEIDAFTTLGISPVVYLVLPRLLAIFAMMPLLTIYADAIGIFGGLAVSATMLDLSPKQFLSGLLTAVTISDAVLGVVKGTVFGFIVGVAGCMKGLQAGSDAGAVGRAATAAVVLGITLIITANAVIDWLAALLEV